MRWPSLRHPRRAVTGVDKMLAVEVYCNFHHEHFIDPTNRPWVSEDEFEELGRWLHRKIIILNAESIHICCLIRFCTSFSLVIPH